MGEVAPQAKRRGVGEGPFRISKMHSNGTVVTGTSKSQFLLGAVLVAGSALTWSLGGTIARFVATDNSWTIVFWRSFFAASFLMLFMLVRVGSVGTERMFRSMGWAGLAVAACIAIASTAFVVALAYTTVANILLIQAAVPLLSATLAFFLFGERPALSTWISIAVVVIGLSVMVWDSLTGKVSPIGDGLAMLIAVAFSIATVITRRAAHVRMLPAVCLGTTFAGIFSAFIVVRAGAVSVSASDLALLMLFGAANLGAGLAMFAMGARLLPAAIAALIGTLETVLAPLWVWLVHGEVPSKFTIIGGAIVFAAILSHLLLELRVGRKST
jgi:drug/metabolite transporter (DMT)-like permease